jgi:hypothetical protein
VEIAWAPLVAEATVLVASAAYGEIACAPPPTAGEAAVYLLLILMLQLLLRHSLPGLLLLMSTLLLLERLLFQRTMCGSRTGGWSLPCVMSD